MDECHKCNGVQKMPNIKSIYTVFTVRFQTSAVTRQDNVYSGGREGWRGRKGREERPKGASGGVVSILILHLAFHG